MHRCCGCLVGVICVFDLMSILVSLLLHARRFVSVCVFVAHHDVRVRCMFTLLHVHDWDVG